MTDWIRSYKSTISPDGLGPLQLAWLGDSVWEMHQRLRYCSSPMRSKDLHNAVVIEVNASRQARAVREIEPFLTETEKEFLRRGRSDRHPGWCWCFRVFKLLPEIILAGKPILIERSDSFSFKNNK